MTQQNPTIREDLDVATPERMSDILRTIQAGDFIALLIDLLSRGARVQSASFVPGAVNPTVTFAALGMLPPMTLNYRIFAASPTSAARFAAGSKTLTQFGLVGATVVEATDVVMIEDAGPAQLQLAVATNAAALPWQPGVILDVQATAGTLLGRLTLIQSSNAALVPASGQVIWDKGVNLRFAAADAITGVKVSALPRSNATTGLLPPTAALLERILGQRDK
jgi:hypothetical protein